MTDAILDERPPASPPLEPIYPLSFFEALHIKDQRPGLHMFEWAIAIRDDGQQTLTLLAEE